MARDFNLYRYVGNRIVNLNDSMGLDGWYFGGPDFNDDGTLWTPPVPAPKKPKPNPGPGFWNEYCRAFGDCYFPKPKPAPSPKPSKPGDCPEGQVLVPNPDNPPAANGCGPLNKTPQMISLINSLQMGLGASSLIFESACDSHDLCYGNCSASKGKCDDNFYLDMISACKKTFMSAPPQKYQDCELLASLFAAAVNKGGDKAFDDARSAHCHCECP